MKKLLFTGIGFAMSCMFCSAQKTTSHKALNGKITDAETGQPMSGITLTERYGKISSVSDERGEFSLRVPALPDTIEISYVGYKTRRIAVTARSSRLSVTMQRNTTQLEDVLVTTAFGIQRQKKELGYAVSSISGDELRTTAPVNLLSGLTGKVAGLSISNLTTEVTQDLRVSLRGVRSLTGNNNPLFVLDGAPLLSDANASLRIINGLNPDDVLNVTVLKGANASALYGPEGANGVIIITTKKGVGRAHVSFRHSTTLQKIDKRYPKYQTIFGSGSLTDQFDAGVYNPADNFSWGPVFDGKQVVIGRPDENGSVQKVPYRYADQRHAFFQAGVIVQNDISLSGGDQSSNYFFSAGHSDIRGILPGDRADRTTVRMNAGKKFGKLGTNYAITYVRSSSDQSLNQAANLISTSLINIPGQVPITSYKNYRSDKWATHDYYFSDFYLNPYEEANYFRNLTHTNALTGNVELSFTILNGLKVLNRTGINFLNELLSYPQQALTFSDFALTNGANGRYISSYNSPAGISDASSSITSINNDLLLALDKNAGDFHVRANAGTVVRNTESNVLSAYNGNLIIPDLFTYSNGSGTTYTSKTIGNSRLFSLLGTSSVGYKDFAFVELTTRKDWNSKIAHNGNRTFYSGINGSLSLAELFPRLAGKRVNQILLKAAYNQTANVNTNAYLTETQFVPGTGFPFGNLASFVASVPGQPYLRPEKILSQEYGFSVKGLNNRASLNVAYYYQRNDDQILNVNVSAASSYQSLNLNAGSFYNQGLEIDLEYRSSAGSKRSLQYQVGGNLSVNNSKVLSLFQGLDQISVGAYSEAVKGSPAYQLVVQDWMRDSAGKVIVDKTTGLPTLSANPVVAGRNIPKYMFGFTGNLSWKRLSFSMVPRHASGRPDRF